MGKRNEAKQWEDDVAGMFSTVVQGDLYCRDRWKFQRSHDGQEYLH